MSKDLAAVVAAQDQEGAAEAAYLKLPRGTTPAQRKKFDDAALEVREARRAYRNAAAGAGLLRMVNTSDNDGSAD